MSRENEILQQTETLLPSDLAATARFHLVVIRGETSATLALPHTGVIRIGRDPDADIILDDGKVSREHARILLADGQAVISDLDSRNGTRVNGDRLVGSATLAIGDVVSIGMSHLVLHGQARAPERRAMRELSQFYQRVAEEIERAIECRRELAVVALPLGALDPTRGGAIEAALQDQLRRIDLASHDGARWLYVLLPEVDGPHARRATAAVIAALEHPSPLCAGVASCPHDACDPDTLLAVARSAAEAVAAPAGDAGDDHPGRAIGSAEDCIVVRRLDDRSVTLADPAMIRLYDLIERLAASDLAVLVTGETGCGKENAAFALHCLSPRRSSGSFVTLNCAALQDSLFESELFGYVKGAFSGAAGSKPGLLELASGGTVFLDEIGEMSASAQAKLLRVLETGKLTRLGDVRERDIDIRVVAATNRDLLAEVEEKRFRRDLYFRISAAAVHLPPLRERPREIPILARLFTDQACQAAARDPLSLSGATLARLAAYDWPGNVRELKSALEFAVATVTGFSIEPGDLPDRLTGGDRTEPAGKSRRERDGDSGGSADDPSAGEPKFRPLSEELEELERLRMAQALRAAGGVKTRAARLIDMPLRTFVHKLKRYEMAGKPEPS